MGETLEQGSGPVSDQGEPPSVPLHGSGDGHLSSDVVGFSFSTSFLSSAVVSFRLKIKPTRFYL